MADARRRQPGYGQRQRRRKDAVAFGSLRQRRLCDRHDDRQSQNDSLKERTPRPGRLAAPRTLFPRSHGEPALRSVATKAMTLFQSPVSASESLEEYSNTHRSKDPNLFHR